MKYVTNLLSNGLVLPPCYNRQNSWLRNLVRFAAGWHQWNPMWLGRVRFPYNSILDKRNPFELFSTILCFLSHHRGLFLFVPTTPVIVPSSSWSTWASTKILRSPSTHLLIGLNPAQISSINEMTRGYDWFDCWFNLTSLIDNTHIHRIPKNPMWSYQFVGLTLSLSPTNPQSPLSMKRKNWRN